jgi:hypothetical protein
MVFQRIGSTQSIADRRSAAIGHVFYAVLTLSGGMNASAQTPDRYRCIPTDGSQPYTTPGTCRGDVIRREPLSQQEIAEAFEIQTRGREFTRCTAEDGRYSFFVSSEKACPSPTDKRTVEYATKSIQQQKYETDVVTRAAESVGTQSAPPVPQVAADAAPLSAPVPVTAPVPAPSVALPPVLPPPRPSVSSPVARLMSILGWLVPVVLGIWWVMSWRSRRSTAVKAAKPTPTPTPTPSESVRQPVQSATAAMPAAKPAAAGQKSAQDKPVPTSTEMDQQAQTLLALLENPNAAASTPGGLAFLTALQQAKLDYSLESVGRVDQLLAQIKTKIAPQPGHWHKQSGTENFCLLLAFYLGTVISRQSNMPIQWYSREQAAPMMPPDMPLPDANWSRLVGIIAASACVPLGVIEDSLFGNKPEDGPVDMMCKAYVERLIGRMRQALTPGMDENKRCAIMLETFFGDTPMFGGLAFGEQLKQARLDYSLDSLQRLDRLLRLLRAEIKPPYTDFINQSESQNFMRFAAFYIGMTIARVGAMSVKWLDFEQAKNGMPELEFQFETSSVCLLGGRFYFPLGLVTEILLQPQATRNIPEWAKQVLKGAPPPMQSILRSSLQSAAADASMDKVLKSAIERAGFTAAWAMFMVEGGANGAPTVFVPKEGEGEAGMFMDFSFYGDGEAAFQAAHGQMQGNPNAAPYQVMSFDGYANLHTGRTDALTIDLCVYAANPVSSDIRFKLTVICPYRNAGDPKGFAIFSPKVTECSAPTAMHDAISKHFYQGVASYKSQTFDWFEYLDEGI